MRLLKAKEADSAAPVTREEFAALRAELAALQKVTAIALVCVDEAIKNPAIVDGSARRRLEKVAAASDVFGLSDAETASLHGLLALVREARDCESDRERNERSRRARPLTSDDFMPGGRCAPRV